MIEFVNTNLNYLVRIGKTRKTNEHGFTFVPVEYYDLNTGKYVFNANGLNEHPAKTALAFYNHPNWTKIS